MTFLHRFDSVGHQRDEHSSDRDAVLRVGSGHPGCRNADRRPELRANTRRHLQRDGLVDCAALGEQPLVHSQNRRLDVGRIHNRSPDDNPRRTSGMNERRADETTRQGFGDGNRLAGSSKRVNQSGDSCRGGVIHQAQPRIAFHTYSIPVHSVSATAATISAALNQFIQSPSNAGNGANANETAMACAVVLTLPPQDAA